MKPVVLINPFEVPEGEDHAFLDAWEEARRFMSRQPGFISTRLHRRVHGSAGFQFVNVAEWETEQAFRDAVSNPEFQDLASQIGFPGRPALYEVIRR